MFCFNVKNLRYAIGNVEVGKEKLLAAKRTLLDGINRNLEKTGDVGFGIYDFVDEKISSESV